MLKFLRPGDSNTMDLSSKRLAGPGFIILNVLRAMNITSLLAVIAASMVMVIKTFTRSKFYFFDAASDIVVAITSMFLITSESTIFKGYFARSWPLLSSEHSFNFLGISMIVIGNNLLGCLNKEATSQESLGMPFWRLLIGAGIVVFVLGFVNILASFIFRDAALGVTARQIRSKGAVAISDREVRIEAEKSSSSVVSSFPGSSVYSQPTGNSTVPPLATSPVRARPFKPSPVKSWFRSARDSILPSYHSRPPAYGTNQPKSPVGMAYSSSPTRASPSVSRTPTGSSSSGSSGKKQEKDGKGSPGGLRGINISAPLNINPQFAHLIRPDMAHHPTNRRPDGSF